MTIASTKSSITLVGNGVNKTWDFDFTVWAAGQVAVWLTDPVGATTQVTSDFVVSLNANQAVTPGGVVTYPVAAAAIGVGYSLTIIRNMGFLQGIDLQKNQGFDPEVLEAALDQAAAERQQLKEAIGRTIMAAPGGTPENYLSTIAAIRDAAIIAQGEAEAAAQSAAISKTDAETAKTDAQGWASKTSGLVSTDYSAKAYAVGGVGVTEALGAAKEWATTVGAAVVAGYFSAKEWAVGTFTRGQAGGGSAKDWANYTSGVVDDAAYSAKEHAVGVMTASGGSAKAWATSSSSPDGTASKSAKTWAGEAAASAASLNMPAITSADAGKRVIVNPTGTGYALTPGEAAASAASLNMPAITSADAGKRVIVNPTGTGYALTPGSANAIGIAGGQGFGVGICPAPPIGFTELAGCQDPASDNYGNYLYQDGSVMVWVPAFFYKWGTGSNGLALNAVDIKPFSAYADVAAANAAGYALHRAFYDGGAAKSGFFVDKYLCSNNAGVASAIKHGNPLSSNSVHNPFAGLTGAPPNFYYGAIAAAKTRGSSFFCSSRFIFAALALLSYAHAKASSAATYCAWYDTTNNFPKGYNNNALGDAQDAAILYVSDGYFTAAKTGSANLFSRTTHNGQNCGVADQNGCMWEITPGLATNAAATTFYILKTSAAMKNVTGGNTLATDLWGAAGLAALYDSLGATYGAALASSTLKYYGSASQVFSEAVSGNAWNWAGAGGPLAAGVGGTNIFGNDGFWDYRPAEMCPVSGGNWSNASNAGVWTFDLYAVRGYSAATVGFRAALYL